MSDMLPSVVLIVIDALRYDCVPGAPDSAHLRAARATLPDLPALAQLVHGAHQFTQAIACAPYTPAALATMFTGLLPPEHGVRAHAASALSPDVRTLAAILASAGYHTGAMSDYPDVLAPVGLLKDFQTTLKNEEDALTWWDAFDRAPRFLLLHLWDVHKPYGMPVRGDLRGDYPQRVAAWQARLRENGVAIPADLDQQVHAESERHKVNVMQCLWEEAAGWQAGLQAYLDGLQTFDRGRLRQLVEGLKKRGILDNALLVVTSDHGEGRSIGVHGRPNWGTRGRLNHSANLLDDVVRVPLFVHVPGAAHLHATAEQVSQADVTPTLLDALGLLAQRTPERSASSGRSLLPYLSGKRLPPSPAYAEISLGRPAHGAAQPLPDDPPSIVHQRILRYPQRKIHLTGQMAHLDDAWLHAPAEVYVRRLYRELLGRFEGADGLAWWLAKLADEGDKPDIQHRRAVAQAFAESPEAARIPKHAIYDLRSDGMEEHPHTPASSVLFWPRYRPYAARLQQIDRCARTGAPLLASDSDEEIVAQRLQALGYIE